MVVRGELTKEKLENIYLTIRNIVKKKSCYYTQEEIDKLKKDSNNIFFERRWRFSLPEVRLFCLPGAKHRKILFLA